MKKDGFTLVELLAVIAILALLVIIALPNVLKMFNNAKKDLFLTEAKNIYKEVSKKYISETMRGNKVSNISNSNNKLDLESNNLKYNIKLNNDGSIKKFEVSNGTYCISGNFNNLSELTADKITDKECDILASTPETIRCYTKNKEVPTQGLIYETEQYSYAYKMFANVNENDGTIFWQNNDIDTNPGWGVKVKDASKTDDLTENICAYINDEPVTTTFFMYGLSKANNVDLSSFDTSNVTNMTGMFLYSSLKNLDLSKFNTSSVTDMTAMFAGTSNLTSLNLDSFDTSNVTNMCTMFGASAIKELTMSGFNTSKVIDMSSMFASTSNLVLLDLNDFDTSKVTDMRSMFANSSITTLDISSFDTSKVTNMNNMFENASNLTTIYVGTKWKEPSGANMFDGCNKLVGSCGTSYANNRQNVGYAHVDGKGGIKGYFSSKTEKYSCDNLSSPLA